MNSEFLLCVKIEKLGIRIQKNTCWKKKNKQTNLGEPGRGSYYKQDGWLEAFLDDKGAFYNGSESDDSDNDDETYNENIEAVVWQLY